MRVAQDFPVVQAAAGPSSPSERKLRGRCLAFPTHLTLMDHRL